MFGVSVFVIALVTLLIVLGVFPAGAATGGDRRNSAVGEVAIVGVGLVLP